MTYKEILRRCLIVCSFVFFAHEASARSIYFPKPTIDVEKLNNKEVPSWLRTGSGDDGYVRVTVDAPTKNGCIPVGSTGFLKLIAAEKVQLSVSVKVAGIRSPMEGREIPIALIDGRNSAGGCILLTVLDSAMTIVPMARLEPVSSTEPIRFEVVVKSSSAKDVNVIGPAQTLLGVASVFATGGAATTIAGLTAGLAQPAFQKIEDIIEKSQSGITQGRAIGTLNWQQAREVKRMKVPVFLGKTVGFSEDDSIAIPRLQRLSENGDGDIQFHLELNFSYLPNAFELPFDINSGVPDKSEISESSILRYPSRSAVAGLAQVLDPAKSALSKATTPGALAEACNLAISTLTEIGFARWDRAVALVSLVNSTRNSSWIETTQLKDCITSSSTRADVVKIYGGGQVAFRYADARDRFSSYDEPYDSWYEVGVPILDELRRALTELNSSERYRLLKLLSPDNDIKLDASKIPSAWPDADELEPPSSKNIRRLANKSIMAAGCFTYPYRNSKFQPAKDAGALILLDESNDIWVATVSLANEYGQVISGIRIDPIHGNWWTVLNGYLEGGFFGVPTRGDCAKIRAHLKK